MFKCYNKNINEYCINYKKNINIKYLKNEVNLPINNLFKLKVLDCGHNTNFTDESICKMINLLINYNIKNKLVNLKNTHKCK